jgi:hypothetical protein
MLREWLRIPAAGLGGAALQPSPAAFSKVAGAYRAGSHRDSQAAKCDATRWQLSGPTISTLGAKPETVSEVQMCKMAMRTVHRPLKLNRLVRDPRLKIAAVGFAHAVGMRHLVVRFDPVVACNLRAVPCAISNSEYVRTYKGMFFPKGTHERFMVGRSFEKIRALGSLQIPIHSRLHQLRLFTAAAE